MTTRRHCWRWTNFPIPQAHLVVGGVCVVLGLLWPLTLGWDGPWPWAIGLALVVLGVGLMIWATAAAGSVVLADPNLLVTNGPYRISRHPMYVGWTLVFLGLVFISRSVWFVILLPILALWIHLETGREEQRMFERFRDSYTTYQSKVRRYL